MTGSAGHLPSSLAALTLLASGSAGPGLAAQAPSSSPLEIAASASSRGEALAKEGRDLEAEPFFRRALTIRETTPRVQAADIAASADQLGSALQALGRYDEAEPLLRRVVAIDTETLGAEDPETAGAMDNLGMLEAARGRYDEAETLQRRALEILERTRGPEHPETAAALDNLAVLLRTQGRLAQAEPLVRRALATYEKALGPDDPETATTASNLAGLLEALGQYDEAEPLLRRALAIDERALGASHPDTAIALDNLALLLKSRGRYAEAEPLARRALAIFQAKLGPDHPDTATALENLADLSQSQGRYAEAETMLRRALAIRERALGPQRPETAEAREALAFTLEHLGKLGEAAANYRIACAPRAQPEEAAEPTGEAAKTAEARAANCSTKFSLALRQWFEAGGGAAENDRPEALRQEGFQWAQRAARSAAGDALARSAALTAATSLGVGEEAAAYEAALAERVDLDEAFAKAAGEPGRGGREERTGLAKARTEVLARTAALARKLRKEAPLYWLYRSPDPVSVAALQARTGPDAALLNDNEALLLFLLPPGDERGLVFAVSKERVGWARVGLTGDELRQRIGGLRARIEARRAAFDRRTAFEIHQALLGDPAIQAVIRDKPVLLFVPSGPLNSLPPGLLVTAPPEGGVAGDADQAQLRATPWLLRSKAVAILPSVSSLRTLRQLIPAHRPTAPDPVLAFADPDFGGGTAAPVVAAPSAGPATPRGVASYFRGGEAMGASLRRLPRLPGTRLEGQALEAALGGRPGSLLLGADASKAQLMARNADGRLAKVRVLEFATHGLVAGAADWLDEPALALAAGPRPEDQLLLASDASTLKLNADWVLLSACDTASPDAPEAEGLSGLTRAFFFAGARSLLVSHWPVRDDVAARLIPATLLAERGKRGLGRAEALREAALAILDDVSLHAANPVAWAPFTLVGEAGR
jgi:CHAT domain-containing protein/Tfp pilus assembly protein PilF